MCHHRDFAFIARRDVTLSSLHAVPCAASALKSYSTCWHWRQGRSHRSQRLTGWESSPQDLRAMPSWLMPRWINKAVVMISFQVVKLLPVAPAQGGNQQAQSRLCFFFFLLPCIEPRLCVIISGVPMLTRVVASNLPGCLIPHSRVFDACVCSPGSRITEEKAGWGSDVSSP